MTWKWWIAVLFSLAVAAHRVGADTSGTKFVLAFPNNHLSKSDQSYTEILTVMITNPDEKRKATVQIKSPFPGFQENTVTVLPATTTKLQIKPVSIQTNYMDEQLEKTVQEKKGILITSSLPVTVIAENQHTDGGSTETFTVFSTCQLGTAYRTVNDEGTTYKTTNLFSVVAVSDNTKVNMETPAGPVSTTLQALETFTFSSALYILTGRSITADKPVAVFSGATCGFGFTQQGSCNHEVVQLIPISSWGKQYAVASFHDASSGEFIIIPQEDNTTVSIDGVVLGVLKQGAHRNMYRGHSFVTADKKIDVIAVGGTLPSNSGAPFFTHAPAASQFVTGKTTFTTAMSETNPEEVVHFIRVITTLPHLGKISIDNARPHALLYTRIGRSTYYYYETAVSPGLHTIKPDNDAAKYGTVAYGYGMGIGYGYTPNIDLPCTQLMRSGTLDSPKP